MYLLLFLLAATFGCVLAAPDSATAQPALALPGLWIITDFQGTIFNLVDTQETNATPVQGFNADSGTVTASQWIFVNTTANEFQIINVGGGSFLSYSTLVTGAEAIKSQLVGNQISTTWLFTPPKGMLIESRSGFAITSYATNREGTHPFTLEPTNPSDPAQIFSISAAP
ncbi:hypothetical protein C8R45DRAFT_1104553 [Mycena sanguinolenta]|nr:hypothetical protein C8R45DRAFT_1104553 [Mycena sanguinolenta]